MLRPNFVHTPAAAGVNAQASVDSDPIPSMESLLLDYDVTSEITDLIGLDDTLDNLGAIYDNLAVYGVTESVISLVDTENVLSANLPNFPSTESLQTAGAYHDYSPNSPESIAVMEGIMDSIKETLAAWSKKAMEFGAKIWDGTVNLLKAGVAKITEFGTWLKDKVMAAPGEINAAVKVHPYASAAAAAAGAAAIVAACTLVWPMALPTAAGAVAAPFTKAFAALKKVAVPMRTYVPDPANPSNLIVQKNAAEKLVSGAKAASEWGGKKATSLVETVKTTFGSSGPVVRFLGTVKTTLTGWLGQLGKLSGEALTNARRYIGQALRFTWSALTKGVMYCFNFLRAAFGSLRKLFKRGGAAKQELLPPPVKPKALPAPSYGPKLLPPPARA